MIITKPFDLKDVIFNDARTRAAWNDGDRWYCYGVVIKDDGSDITIQLINYGSVMSERGMQKWLNNIDVELLA